MKLLDPLLAHIFTAALFHRQMRREHLLGAHGSQSAVASGRGCTPAGLLHVMRKDESMAALRLPLTDAVLLSAAAETSEEVNIFVVARLVDGLRSIRDQHDVFARQVALVLLKKLDKAKEDVMRIVERLERRTMTNLSKMFIGGTGSVVEEFILLLTTIVDALPPSSSPEMRVARRVAKLTIGHMVPDHRRVEVSDLVRMVSRFGAAAPAAAAAAAGVLRLLETAATAETPERALLAVRDAYSEIHMQAAVFPAELKRAAELATYAAMKKVVRSLNLRLAATIARDRSPTNWQHAVVLGTTFLRATITGSKYPETLILPTPVRASLSNLAQFINPKTDRDALTSLRALGDFYGLAL